MLRNRVADPDLERRSPCVKDVGRGETAPIRDALGRGVRKEKRMKKMKRKLEVRLTTVLYDADGVIISDEQHHSSPMGLDEAKEKINTIRWNMARNIDEALDKLILREEVSEEEEEEENEETDNN